ncbi:MAG: type II secretion system F family protein [Planctomycetota bacterium]
MLDTALVLALIVLIGTFLFALLSSRDEDAGDGTRASEQRPGWVLLGAVLAAGVAALVLLAVDAPFAVVGAAALLVGIAAHAGLRGLEARRAIAFDLSLASSLDMAVASLRSGAALLESLTTAADESSGRARAMLVELCDRIRLGENPVVVLEDLAEDHPGEGPRLFAFTLASHFDSGGSAASSLAQVAKTLRERVDVLRRASSQAVETQASVVGILGITYGLAFLMWSQYPERVEDFVGSSIGLSFVVASVVLQAIGLAWISSMVRVEV